MRISIVEPHLEIFGGIRRILELSNRLVRAGDEVTIFTPQGKPADWMECAAEVRADAEFLAAEHEVVLYNDPTRRDYELVKKARADLKVYYVLELYETSMLTGFQPLLRLPRFHRTRYLRKALLAGHLILVNATWMKEWLSRNMNLESVLLLGGVNTDVFHPAEVARDPSRFRVLCSGDPRPRKGTATVRRAVEIARRQHPEIELDTYHGKGIPQESMAETYGAADLFVEASRQAGWNNPVAEAMACKVPVICTDIGGVRDFAFHQETALLVPFGHPDALARAIARMKEDLDLRRRLAARAYEHILGFRWDESAARLRKLLAEALGR